MTCDLEKFIGNKENAEASATLNNTILSVEVL